MDVDLTLGELTKRKRGGDSDDSNNEDNSEDNRQIDPKSRNKAMDTRPKQWEERQNGLGRTTPPGPNSKKGKTESTETQLSDGEESPADVSNPVPFLYRDDIDYGNIIIIQNENAEEGLPIRSAKLKNTLNESAFANAGIISMKPIIRTKGVVMEVRDKAMITDLLKVKKIGQWNIKCRVPKINTSRIGVLGPVDMFATVKEVEEELKDQEIEYVKVEKMFKGKKEEKVPTAFFKVEFVGRELPDSVDFGLAKAKVKPYKRRVLQCFKCRKIGHSREYCQNESEICPKSCYRILCK